jgi:hypothetical protein
MRQGLLDARERLMSNIIALHALLARIIALCAEALDVPVAELYSVEILPCPGFAFVAWVDDWNVFFDDVRDVGLMATLVTHTGDIAYV